MVCFGEFPDKMSGMLQIKNGSRKNCADLLFHGIVSFCNDECHRLFSHLYNRT